MSEGFVDGYMSVVCRWAAAVDAGCAPRACRAVCPWPRSCAGPGLSCGDGGGRVPGEIALPSHSLLLL